MLASADLMDDVLRSLRISGSLLLRESYAPAWAVAIPGADKLGALMRVAPRSRVVAFHLVEFGHCELRPNGAERCTLTAGDLAICFGGMPHRLSLGKSVRAQDIATLLAGGVNTQRPEQGGVGTALLCGAFTFQHTRNNPLLDALPPVLRVKLSRPGSLHNLTGVAQLLAAELERAGFGQSFVVERLVEVLCAEAIRAHLKQSPENTVGWFRGIKDPVVGRALAAMHRHPGQDWTVPRLAAEVAISPSRFAARFTACLAESPMAFLAKWRMNIACRHLTTSHLSIDTIATDVGYDSVAAFNRAFKKHLGLPPATWRARAQAEPTT